MLMAYVIWTINAVYLKSLNIFIFAQSFRVDDQQDWSEMYTKKKNEAKWNRLRIWYVSWIASLY